MHAGDRPQAGLHQLRGTVLDPPVLDEQRVVPAALAVPVPDIAAYDRFYKKLIAKIELSDVSSSFAMEQIKYTTALPLDYA